MREQPFLALRGTGTLIGIVDTGIRYEHEVFVREDGSSIIDAIWDQTAENADSFSFNTERELNNMVMYGRVYANAMINEALSAPNSSGHRRGGWTWDDACGACGRAGEA